QRWDNRNILYPRHARCGKDVRFCVHDLQGKESPGWYTGIYPGRLWHHTARVLLEGRASLDDLPGVVKVTDQGRWQELRLEVGANPQLILSLLIKRGVVRHFELTRPTLHDIFVRIAAPSPEDNGHA